MTNYVNQKDEQLNLQRQKVAEQQEAGRQFRFIGGQQFFTSMRDVGYGNEGQALMDIIDNGIEAGATEIHVLIQNDGPYGRIEAMAVVDNGHGMDPAWLEASIGFGSTSRGTKRDGLGRFGMGLSSAGIAFSELLEVYSTRPIVTGIGPLSTLGPKVRHALQMNILRMSWIFAHLRPLNNLHHLG